MNIKQVEMLVNVLDLLDETWNDYLVYKEQKYIIEYKAMYRILAALDIKVSREGNKHKIKE